MMKISIILFILGGYFGALTENREYNYEVQYDKSYKRYFAEDSTCLDGSPSVYYYYRGNSSDLIIYLYSGGYCFDGEQMQDNQDAKIDNCQNRTNTLYGSTVGYPETLDQTQGMMSNDATDNPFLVQASKVWLMYCDGSLYFNQMSRGVLEKILLTLNLQPDRVILAGSEVGGVYILNNHKQLIEGIKHIYAGVQVRVILENAMWILKGHKEDLLYNALKDVARRTNRTVGDLLNWNVMIDSPVFIIQPQYDWWILNFSHGELCHQNIHLEACTPNEIDRINDIRKQYVSRLLKLVKKHEDWGLWSIGCLWKESLIWNEAYHDQTHRIPHTEGLNLDEALYGWLSGEGRHIYYDISPWPSNKGCSNTRSHTFPVTQPQSNPGDEYYKAHMNMQDQDL